MPTGLSAFRTEKSGRCKALKVLRKLTLKDLRLNRVRTVMTILGILLSTALITAVACGTSSMKKTMINSNMEISGNWTFAAYKEFGGDIEKAFSDKSEIEAVYRNVDIGVAEFQSKSKYKPYVNIKGFTEETLRDCFGVQLESGAYPKNSDEVLLTQQFLNYSEKEYKVGDTITLKVGSRWVKGSVTDGKLPEYGSDSYYDSYISPYDSYNSENEDFIEEFTKSYKITGIVSNSNSGMGAVGFSTIALLTGLDNSGISQNSASVPYEKLMVKLYDDREKEYPEVISQLTGLSPDEALDYLNGYIDDDLFDEKMSSDRNILKISSFERNLDLLKLKGVVEGGSTMNAVYGASAFVYVVIMLSGIFIIRNSFAISITEKTRLYGMLSSIGATPKQIRANVLFEGAVLGLFAIPAGVLLGVGVTALLLYMCNCILGEELVSLFMFDVSFIGIAVSVILSVITIFCSTYLTAVKASKLAPVEAIKGNSEIKVKKKSKIKNYRTPKLIENLFGAGGSIAWKNLKRNRRKYRATVISLIVSITMFISMYSFITYAFDFVSETDYGKSDMQYDLQVVVYNNGSISLVKEHYPTVMGLDGVTDSAYSANAVSYVANVDKKYISKEALEYDGSTSLYGNIKDLKDNEPVKIAPKIMCIDDDNYKAVISSLGLDYNKVKNKGLIANYNTESTENSVEENKIPLLSKADGTVMKLSNEYDESENRNDFEIEIAGEITENSVISKLKETGITQAGTILLSSEFFEKNIKSGTYCVIWANSSNPDKTETEINDNMPVDFMVYNRSAYINIIKSFMLIVQIFVYGFITVISLIGMTNIFNTITTNMRLRNREFAMLRSVGMTEKEFNRMILLESVFYTLRSLVIGVILGTVLGVVIYFLMNTKENLVYQFPFMAIIISAAAVTIVVWAIMRYSVRKVKKQNIIETIRNENI